MNKEAKRIIRALLKAGWTIQHSKHTKCKTPDGKMTFMLARTASDPHAYRNFLSDIKRAGYGL